MSNTNTALPQHEIKCWSEQKNEYVPTAWPKFNSPSEARTFGKANIKATEFIVETVK